MKTFYDRCHQLFIIWCALWGVLGFAYTYFAIINALTHN